jgi:hypothetical protein
MKALRKITLLAICTGMMLIASSCAVMVSPRHDRGLHRGWYKQSNSPNHSVRAAQGTRGVWIKKSPVTKSHGSANQGKHKGQSKNKKR